jgi:hypothetical protein
MEDIQLMVDFCGAFQIIACMEDLQKSLADLRINRVLIQYAPASLEIIHKYG